MLLVAEIHQRETTYLEMSRGLAQSGIEKWTVDTGRRTMTFYDKAGRETLVGEIQEVTGLPALVRTMGSRD